MYYIYLHIKLTNGSPFYVGKGKDRRALCKRSRSIHWHNIVKKHGYDIIILEDDISEDEANILEKYWIKRIGRYDLKEGPLVNFTDGGEGSSGRPMNQKTKDILSLSNTNRPTSLIQKNVVGARYRGKYGILHNRSKAIVDIRTGIEYGSISEAARILNKAVSSVHYQMGMHFQFVKP